MVASTDLHFSRCTAFFGVSRETLAEVEEHVGVSNEEAIFRETCRDGILKVTVACCGQRI